jgi:integration host factor subunit alpha
LKDFLKRRRFLSNLIIREFQKGERETMSLTKAELIDILCEKTGVTRNQSVEFLERVFAIMKETLENGETVKVSGFGNFIVREKKPRKGRNPKTGLELTIAARRVLTFKPSHVLRKAVNQGASSSSPFGATEEGFNDIGSYIE